MVVTFSDFDKKNFIRRTSGGQIMANIYNLDICRWRNVYKIFQPNIEFNEPLENRTEKLYYGNKKLKLITEEIPKDETNYRYQKASMWGKIEIKDQIITEMDVFIGGFYIELSPRLKQDRLIEIVRTHSKKSSKDNGKYGKRELDNIAMIKQERSMFEMKDLESKIQNRLWETDIIENRKWKASFGFSKNFNFKKNLIRRESLLEEAIPIICRIARRFGDKAKEEEMMEVYYRKTENWPYNLPADVVKQTFLDSKNYKKEKYIRNLVARSSIRIGNSGIVEIQWL